MNRDPIGFLRRTTDVLPALKRYDGRATRWDKIPVGCGTCRDQGSNALSSESGLTSIGSVVKICGMAGPLEEYFHNTLAPDLMAVAFSLESIRARLEVEGHPIQLELKQIEVRISEILTRAGEAFLNDHGKA